jgi:hypothetical protein
MPGIDWTGRRPPRSRPRVERGDIVVPDMHPQGFDRWVVVEVSPAAGPSDVVLLGRLDPACPTPYLRRTAGTLTIAEKASKR